MLPRFQTAPGSTPQPAHGVALRGSGCALPAPNYSTPHHQKSAKFRAPPKASNGLTGYIPGLGSTSWFIAQAG